MTDIAPEPGGPEFKRYESGSFPTRLDADWEDLVRRPETAALLESLRACRPGLDSCDANALVVVIGSTRDEGLIRLLVTVAQEAGARGRISARILLQALRPLIARLARQISLGSTFSDAFAHVTAELYEVIRTFPLHRDGSTLANVRMELVGRLFGEKRAHHPVARRAINAAVPTHDIEALHAERAAPIGSGPADRGEAASPVEDSALKKLHALGVLQRAEATGLCRGEESSERIELLGMLVWALEEGVITEGQARALANDGRIEDAASPRRLAAASRARQRGLSRLRLALPRYLAADSHPDAADAASIEAGMELRTAPEPPPTPRGMERRNAPSPPPHPDYLD
jgi:hypothetical protein